MSTKANAFISCTLTACRFRSMHCCLGRGQILPSPGKAFVKAGKKTFWLTDCLWNLSRKRDLLFPFPSARGAENRCKMISDIGRPVCLTNSQLEAPLGMGFLLVANLPFAVKTQ